MKHRYALVGFVQILLLFVIGSCGPSSPPSAITTETNSPVEPVSTPEDQLEVDPVNTATPENAPRPEVKVPSYIGEIHYLTSGIIAEDVYNIDIRARSVQIGVNDEILVLGNDTDIFQLAETGDFSLYASFASIGDRVEQFGIDLDGRIMVSTNHSGYYRQELDGDIRQFSEDNSFGRQFVFDSKGNMFTVDFPATRVNKITPDGEVSLIAQGFGEAHNIALTKNDEILIVEVTRGELLKVHLDGTWETITENLSVDESIAVSPDNQVYLYGWFGLDLVNIEARTRTPIVWYNTYNNSGEVAVFNSKGQMFTFHANVPIYKVDLEEYTVETLFSPDTNSFAMAVDPEQRIFVAYGSRLPTGETRIYVIDRDGTRTKLLSVPYNTPRSISIMNDGRGLIELSGFINNTYERAVIAFDPVSGEIEGLLTHCCDTHTQITQNPVSGEFVWFDTNGLKIGSIAGDRREVPFPDPGVLNGTIEISEDGEVFFLASFEPTSNMLFNQQVYRLDPDDNWEVLYSASNSPTNITDIGLCKDNEIYAMGATTDASTIVQGRTGVLYLLMKLKESGELDPLAYDGPVDPFVVDCHTASNFLYFTHIQGVGYFEFED